MLQAQARPPQEILNELRQLDKHKVRVAVADVDGVLRGKYLDKEKFLSAAEGGFGFCDVVFGWDSSDVCYDNGAFTGWHTGYPDAQARVDLATYRRIPWDDGVPFFLAEFEARDGRPLDVCPRQLLKRVLSRARSLGFEARIGMEFEWFNFLETPHTLAEKGFRGMQPLSPGMFGYSILRASLNREFFRALLDDLRAFDVPVEGLHTETGPGVLEAAIRASDALEAADRGVLFKTAVKEIAYRFGIVPTFMAKWNQQLPGSSGHLHQSLWSLDGERNLFHDDHDPLRMSPTFRSYLAGQLHCLPEILPFFAPNVNSYKRLVDGYWAPTKVTWGVDNRTTACRVIPGSAKGTRLELRVPGADVNPYLTIAAAVASGLYGLEHRLELTTPPTQGSAYRDEAPTRLPRNLQEATARLADSKVARELFGHEFVDHFVRTRQWEWRQYQDTVTSWELQRYLEII